MQCKAEALWAIGRHSFCARHALFADRNGGDDAALATMFRCEFGAHVNGLPCCRFLLGTSDGLELRRNFSAQIDKFSYYSTQVRPVQGCLFRYCCAPIHTKTESRITLVLICTRQAAVTLLLHHTIYTVFAVDKLTKHADMPQACSQRVCFMCMLRTYLQTVLFLMTVVKGRSYKDETRQTLFFHNVLAVRPLLQAAHSRFYVHLETVLRN